MAVIGAFFASKDGGWNGTIRTLSIDIKVRFVPNENRDSERAPVFRIFSGRSELGAAWREQSGGDNPREYLTVRLDDPSWPAPVSAAMFEVSGGKEAQLVWNRRPA